MLPKLDNRDTRIRYYELALERSLDGLPDCPLPPGYRFATYEPGDEDAWIDIERSAREFADEAEGREAWRRYYAAREDLLPGRMFFAENAAGEKVATATAFFDIRRPDDGVNGMLHWVAVRREDQGRGLSKPVILQALRRMRELGYTRAAIPTQTTTWLACKVYLDLGFRPIPRNAERSLMGWRIIRALTDHPALAAFEPAEEADILTAP